ncbi:hypothetical protein U14_04036 [Candidatus Moduliflexus flocculans]|uniref:Actin-binding WH2 domain-containing protein n=1 Tax=Candidatus Moduliflexus flocculans TaxID=1499966 RepID=A0A0S6W330_9BACT|nr:hypothetical protein U14_04036 [Candidatus Moduliflexus flocculans]
MSYVSKDATLSNSPTVFEKLTTLNYGPLLLRTPQKLFEKIQAEEDLDAQIQYFAIYALMFSTAYGFLLGMYASGFQILASMIKIPLLFFGTLLLCLPSLYVFNVLLGSQLSFRQTLTILLASTYLMSAILASFAPILFFFILTTSDRPFVSLATFGTCSIAGFFALMFVWKAMRFLAEKNQTDSSVRVLLIWSLIYAIVGTQFAWGLRPFIGQKGVFMLFRALEGNIYVAVFRTIRTLLGL